MSETLRTDYKDDVLDTSKNTQRKYNMINNPDGTVSLQDVTDYLQNGTNFGAGDVNATNEAVNELNDSLKWKLAGKVTGSNHITLPEDFSELSICVYGGTNNSGVIPNGSLHLIKEELRDTIKSFFLGSGVSPNGVGNSVCIVVYASLTEIFIYIVIGNGVNVTGTSELFVYYR